MNNTDAQSSALPLPRMSYRRNLNTVGIDVKDRVVWARDERTASFYDELHEAVIEEAYHEAVEAFWRDAITLAEEAGLMGAYSDGRSGGWLVTGLPQHWTEYAVTDANGYDRSTGERGGEPFAIPALTGEETDADREEYGDAIAQRERFMTFARAVAALQTATEAMFVELLHTAATELEQRREACIVRGEN